MATMPGAAQSREPRSGGKMMRPRRATLHRTPYDRPGLPNSTQQNPNWISRRIFSPTRTIVSGAGRVLSAVFGFDSSSSSSSSDHDFSSDDDGDNNDDQNVSSQSGDTVEHMDPQSFAGKDETKRLIEHVSGDTVEHMEPQSFAGKNQTKRLIEQLLLQETFSREEFDKLINILKSRVVDSPMIGDMGIARLNETPNRTVGSDVEVHDLCSSAVMEARKWLEEKKSGSNSKPDFHRGTSDLDSVALKHGAEGEAGSPVDMAKSYMRTRPPWASPSTNNVEFRSPSPIGMPLFKEETPYSSGGNSLYLSKLRRDSSATGSWNIQEEIRKVRSKATEEMLKTPSSSKIDWSSFALEHKRGPDSLVVENLGSTKEYDPQSSKMSVDASVDFAARPVSQITQDALHNDALPNPATLLCEQNQGVEAIESIVGSDETCLGQRLQVTVAMKTMSNSDCVAVNVDHFKDTNGSTQLLSFTREEAVLDSQVEDKNYSALKEKDGVDSALPAPNGFPLSQSSLSAELNKKQNDGPINEEDNAVVSGNDNTMRVEAKENCDMLSEASVEVPMVNETDAVAPGSPNSSSMQDEGSPQNLNISNVKRVAAGKNNSGIEKQQGKRVGRYNRRGRGRGR